MASWDLAISRLTVYVLLVIEASGTCIRAPAAEKMTLIVGYAGMANVSETERDQT